MNAREWLCGSLSALALVWSTPAAAQVSPMDVVDCAGDPLDLEALRFRLDLELAPDVRARLTSGEQRLVIRRECGSSEVTVRVEDPESRFNVERVVDLADVRGAGRTWTLALVIGDLFERGERAAAERSLAAPAADDDADTPEAADAPGTAHADVLPSHGFLSWRMERPYIVAAQPVAERRRPEAFRFGVATRLYFSEPTFLAGAFVGVQVDWVGLRLVAIGTSATNDQANLTGAVILVEGALRAVELTDTDYRFGLHFTVAGGLVHSETFQSSGDEEANVTLSGASIGAGARAQLTAIFSPEIEGDLSLSVGYDVGQVMSEGLADARGIYASLDLGLRLPL